MAPSVPKAVAKAAKNVATVREVKAATAAKPAGERLTTPHFISRLAEESEVSLKETRLVLQSLQDVVAEEMSKTGESKIPGICILKVRTAKAKPAKQMNMFGKMVSIAAKEERKKLVAFPVKGLCDGALK